MDTNFAISEPLARLIEFHNSFNRSIKVAFGSLSLAADLSAPGSTVAAFALPTGTEPWGRETRWRNLDQRVRDAAVFLAELGIARAAAAFEDYATGAKAELDRAGLANIRPKIEGTSALHGFDAVVGLQAGAIADLGSLAELFDTARNCVVHRSNRSSARLAMLAAAPELTAILKRWPRRKGGWSVEMPLIAEGHVVQWRPRHAILASDVFYRAAVQLDRALINRMGANEIARMAVHWCFFEDPPAPCEAKHSAEVMIRAQLTRRYKVRELTRSDTIALLKAAGRWGAARAAWEKLYPNGPRTALARHRRARQAAPPACPAAKRSRSSGS